MKRALFFSLVTLWTLLGTQLMVEILRPEGMTVIELAILVLFVANFGWISIWFVTAVVGFLLRLTRRVRTGLAEPPPGMALAPRRTALVIPVYNEDPDQVFARLGAMYRSIADLGQLDGFEFYVLSDTTDDAIGAREHAHWLSFLARFDARGRVFYRRRARNIGRKAGNIADFCTRWGYRHDHMIVCDADSVMSGAVLVRLVRLMQANPRAGIIQTVPLPVRSMSLFGRVLQFAARLNSPMLAAGLTFWQASEANYWGHNAIIRVQPFIAHCGLPHLPGQAPLGGEILSHDFVEAALMRRAGWTVNLLPDAGGSYEEMPESLLDFAKRDRRWAQGNLQHLRLVTARGLHMMSRLHFLLGALAYLASPFWFALLLFSTAQILHETTTAHQYFSPGYTLFPNWPVSKVGEIMSLLTMTAITLTLPRGLSLLLALLDASERRGFGGGFRLAVSTALDLLFSMLIAPVMMLLHAYFVVGTLLGGNVTWATQRRGSHRLPVSEAAARLWVPGLLGLIWTALILSLARDYAWWLAPVLAGLLLAVPVAVLSSDERVGRWFARRGLFLTPEERDPPAELRWQPVAPESDMAAAVEAPPLPPARTGTMEPQSLAPAALLPARRRRRRSDLLTG